LEFDVIVLVKVKDVPRGTRVLSTKVVFTRKRDERGNIVKYKARFVVRGFLQSDAEVGDVHAGVVKLECLRVMFSIAAANDLNLYQMDITQAFLHADLDEEIYVRPPSGLYAEEEGYVWKLRKSLYGLRQAPNRFNKLIDRLLRNNGYVATAADPCVYIKTHKTSMIAIGLFVDDLVIAASSEELVLDLKRRLETKLRLKYLGELKFCLGFHVHRNKSTGDITISQEAYAEQVLEMAGMSECKAQKTPFPTDTTFTEEDSAPKNRLDKTHSDKYRSLVGALLYLARGTRPDLAVGVNLLARHVADSGKRHWNALKHMLGYIRGTTSQGITYWGKRR
jgi:hypothetical protein